MSTIATTTNGAESLAPERIVISPPKFRVVHLRLVGAAPYLQARFGEKAMRLMIEKMEAGTTGKKNVAKPPRDFDEDYRQAMHIAEEGWHGVPAPAFRNAAVDACRMAGYRMTNAKMSVFILADGNDRVDGTPLVRLEGGEPERTTMAVRNASGVADLRVRPMWRKWEVNLRVRFDADQFTLSDVVNLFNRAGQQVGVGEGRPFSKASNGLGFGLFEVANPDVPPQPYGTFDVTDSGSA